MRKFHFILLFALLGLPSFSEGQAGDDERLDVIELRNYLVRPGKADDFNKLFGAHFLQPMTSRGVMVPGRFKINGRDDHFVWIRGYSDRSQRASFLKDFYLGDPAWLRHKKEANAMIRNSDNVYLLRPLGTIGPRGFSDQATARELLDGQAPMMAVDFYIANSRLDELIDLFSSGYLPALQSRHVVTSLWVSDMRENEFPQLPAFQDKNLLVVFTFYKNAHQYRRKTRNMQRALTDALRDRLADVVTTHRTMLLERFGI